MFTYPCFSDRCRTAGNLYSQNLCVAVTQKFAGLEPEEGDNSDEIDMEVVIEESKPNTVTQNGKNTFKQQQKQQGDQRY